MKRIILSAAGLFALLQLSAQNTNDSSNFKSRKLKLEEVNLVSSYYSQDGNNAAVTGGIGSQKLTDIANIISVKLTRYDKKLRKHIFDAELGIDHYTSASSDMVDLKANSSASHADTRFYPSLGWTVENQQKGRSVGLGVAYSTEFDYQSIGASFSFSQKTKNRNGEFSAKLQAYLDQVSQVQPVELRTTAGYPTKARNTFAAAFSYSQIVNEKFHLAFLADVAQQQGYLSLPFHRVYFADGSVHQEQVPGNRFKLPVGIRASYFIGDRFIVKANYRFYTDDWGVRSHTAGIELPVKITPFISVSPFYRFYTQTAAKFFGAYKTHTAGDAFYTSNYDLAAFNSNFVGAGLRMAPAKGVLGIQRFNMLEIRYAHYSKNINMNANIISMNLRFK